MKLDSNDVAKLMINELIPRLTKHGLSIKDSPITPQQFAVLCGLKRQGIITHKILRATLDLFFVGQQGADRKEKENEIY